jgi:deoxyribose-phosphate aldolase
VVDASYTTRMQFTARRVLSLTDLTSLNDNDDERSIQKLLKLASTDAGKVAAVCTWARFIAVAKPILARTGIPLAVVANFPAGAADPVAAAAQTTAAVTAGANEIDVVFPYRALMSGDEQSGLNLVEACRAACGEQTLLKVILETGQLGSDRNISTAARIACDGGADFLKTSTGKTQPGATIEAVGVLLDVIAMYAKRGRKVGLKVSGGVRTVEQAKQYLDLYEDYLGVGAATPATFRIGASSLVSDILTVLRPNERDVQQS